MPFVKITRDTVASGMDVKAGQTVELDEEDALTLIAMKKAVPAQAPQAKPAADRGEVKGTTRGKKPHANKKEDEG